MRQFGVFTAQEQSTDNTAPELTVPSDKLTITKGAEANLLEGVTAKDDKDGDLTDKVKVVGNIDTAKPGVYSITYAVTDSAGNQALASRVVEVTTGNQGDNTGSSGSSSGSSNSGSSRGSVLPAILGALFGAAGATAVIAGLLNYLAPEVRDTVKRALGL